MSIYDHFTIKQISSSSSCDQLIDELLSQGTPSTSANHAPAHEIFNLLNAHGCKTVIIENSYMDEDHRMCHARLHHLTQSIISRYCKRLHFFSEEVVEDDLRNISRKLKKSYMGFSIWRPISAFPTGRTILNVNLVTPSPNGKHWKPYLTCQTKFPVNLAGNSLTLSGAPFIQQDHMVSACATASIWMAQYYMANRFDEFRLFSSPEITEAATQYDLSFGRAIPSEGLHNGQILQAFRAIGYDPIAYDLTNSSALVATRLIYRLVESTIPVVIGLYEPGGGHAITAFGHGIDTSAHPTLRNFPKDSRSVNLIRYIDSSDYNTAFIVNDDTAGCYRWMELINVSNIPDTILHRIYPTRDGYVKAFRFLGKLLEHDITVAALFYDRAGEPDMIAGLDFLAAPLPRAITLPPRDAQDKALAVFRTIIADRSIGILPEFTVRTYLIESNAYKSQISTRLNPRTNFVWWITNHYYPKWIWVTEFSVNRPNTTPENRKVIASVIIDSSTPRDTLEFVLLHIGGWVIPVERSELNVIKLIKDIAEGKAPSLVTRRFREYEQLSRL